MIRSFGPLGHTRALIAIWGFLLSTITITTARRRPSGLRTATSRPSVGSVYDRGSVTTANRTNPGTISPPPFDRNVARSTCVDDSPRPSANPFDAPDLRTLRTRFIFNADSIFIARKIRSTRQVRRTPFPDRRAHLDFYGINRFDSACCQLLLEFHGKKNDYQPENKTLF